MGTVLGVVDPPEDFRVTEKAGGEEDDRPDGPRREDDDRFVDRRRLRSLATLSLPTAPDQFLRQFDRQVVLDGQLTGESGVAESVGQSVVPVARWFLARTNPDPTGRTEATPATIGPTRQPGVRREAGVEQETTQVSPPRRRQDRLFAVEADRDADLVCRCRRVRRR
jgi:hypothetical protein